MTNKNYLRAGSEDYTNALCEMLKAESDRLAEDARKKYFQYLQEKIGPAGFGVLEEQLFCGEKVYRYIWCEKRKRLIMVEIKLVADITDRILEWAK